MRPGNRRATADCALPRPLRNVLVFRFQRCGHSLCSAGLPAGTERLWSGHAIAGVCGLRVILFAALSRFCHIAACAGKHRADGPKADDALTTKPDHPMGARQKLIDWRVSSWCWQSPCTGPSQQELPKSITSRYAAKKGDSKRPGGRCVRSSKPGFGPSEDVSLVTPGYPNSGRSG